LNNFSSLLSHFALLLRGNTDKLPGEFWHENQWGALLSISLSCFSWSVLHYMCWRYLPVKKENYYVILPSSPPGFIRVTVTVKILRLRIDLTRDPNSSDILNTWEEYRLQTVTSMGWKNNWN
jgi:hypothetical protein